MARCQIDKLVLNGEEQYVATHQKRAGLLPDKCCDGNKDIVRIACIQDQQAQAKSMSCDVCFSCFGLGRYGVFRIDEKRNRGGSGYQFVQQLNAFCDYFDIDNRNARNISTRSIEALNEARLNRIGAHQESDWDGLRR